MNINLVKQAARYVKEGKTEKALVLLNRIIASNGKGIDEQQRAHEHDKSAAPLEKGAIGQS